MAVYVLSMSLANFMVTPRLSSLLQSHGIDYLIRVTIDLNKTLINFNKICDKIKMKLKT